MHHIYRQTCLLHSLLVCWVVHQIIDLTLGRFILCRTNCTTVSQVNSTFRREQSRDVLKTVGCEMCSLIERSTIWRMGEGEGDIPILDSSSILTALPGNEPTGSLLGERFLICNCPQICPKIGRTKKREIIIKSVCLEIPNWTRAMS